MAETPEVFASSIDDMGGLFSHVSDAYRAGKVSGRQDFFDAALIELQKVSCEQEGQQGELADRGFHVAQQACRVLVRLKKQFDEQKRVV